MVSTQVRTYLGPESTCELGATISDYAVQIAVLSNDVFKDEPGQLRLVDILPAR